MSRQSISLKTRVRYEGLAMMIDRRPTSDLEKLPDPVWYTIGQVLRSKFRKPILNARAAKRAANA